MDGSVVGVSKSATHAFSKTPVDQINLLAGLGVEGDAHSGEMVKHRSRVKQNPDQPNLRQVHLIHAELFDELRMKGFDVGAGDMGENITTRGIDLLVLPVGALLAIGPDAIIEITGLRNPCAQLDNFSPGLMAAVLDRDASGQLIRKAGVMGVVKHGGKIREGDQIVVVLPLAPHCPLAPV